MTTAKESAKLEVLKRIARYKKAPRLAALRSRLRKKLGGDWEVECCVGELVKDGRLRVTGGVFYLPQRLSE